MECDEMLCGVWGKEVVDSGDHAIWVYRFQ